MPKKIAMAIAALALAGGGTIAATSASAEDPIATGEPHLVPMQEISVPIIDGDRLHGSFRVRTVLAATDAAEAARITAALPRLRSASVIAALEFSRLHASPMRAVDAELLSGDLTEALKLEEPGIARALIVEVAARPA